MKSWGVLALGFDGVGEVCLELLLLRLEGRIVRVTVLYQYIIRPSACFPRNTMVDLNAEEGSHTY